jgi:hypothetical protein
MGFRADAMCLEEEVSCVFWGRKLSGCELCWSVIVHVHCDPPCSQIANPQHAADDIPSQVVKHQNLPYRVPILIQDRDRRRGYLVGAGIRVGMAGCGILGMV